MSDLTPVVTGRVLAVSEATRKRNPHLFPPESKPEIVLEGFPQTEAVTREIKEIHHPIMRWCNENHAPYSHARTDKASGINEGAPDFFIVYRGEVWMIEGKTATGKLSEKQRDWHHMAEVQGKPVRIVRSFAEFLALVAKPETTP